MQEGAQRDAWQGLCKAGSAAKELAGFGLERGGGTEGKTFPRLTPCPSSCCLLASVCFAECEEMGQGNALQQKLEEVNASRCSVRVQLLFTSPFALAKRVKPLDGGAALGFC